MRRIMCCVLCVQRVRRARARLAPHADARVRARVGVHVRVRVCVRVRCTFWGAAVHFLRGIVLVFGQLEKMRNHTPNLARGAKLR